MSWYASKTFYFFFIEYKKKFAFFFKPMYTIFQSEVMMKRRSVVQSFFLKSKLNQNLTDHKEVISFSLYLIALLAKYNVIGKNMRI